MEPRENPRGCDDANDLVLSQYKVVCVIATPGFWRAPLANFSSFLGIIDIEKLGRLGESETPEFKTSLASLTKAGETLCGSLNGNGGHVLIGVNSRGEILGQQESDIPFVFDGRPYQRIGSTTSVMPQQVYQRLLLERNHHNHRWETTPALGYSLKDLDTEEILRTVRLGIEVGRLPEQRADTVSTTLNRFGLIKEGQLLNAAVVLFGTKLLPDFTLQRDLAPLIWGMLFALGYDKLLADTQNSASDVRSIYVTSLLRLIVICKLFFKRI